MRDRLSVTIDMLAVAVKSRRSASGVQSVKCIRRHAFYQLLQLKGLIHKADAMQKIPESDSGSIQVCSGSRLCLRPAGAPVKGRVTFLTPPTAWVIQMLMEQAM